MKVKYFVSYSHPYGFGGLEITLSVPITTFKQITDIQEWIAKEYDLEKVAILFYTQLG